MQSFRSVVTAAVSSTWGAGRAETTRSLYRYSIRASSMTRSSVKRIERRSKIWTTRWSINAVAQTSATRTTWAWQIATFFHTGFLEPGPGTWGAAATLGLYAAASFRAPAYAPWIAAGICIASVAAGIPAASIVAREAKIKDPGYVVIDEVAGQALTLIAAPFAWKYVLTGFV